MSSSSTNLGLTLTSSTEDTIVIDTWIDGLTGTGATSNMNKIDTAIGSHTTQILANTQLDPIPYFDTLRKYAPLYSGYSNVAMPNNAAGRGQSVVKGVTLKNELNYNNVTWAEWTKFSGVVGDATGIVFTADGSNYKRMSLPTNLKPSTKYGLCYTVLSNTVNNAFILDSSDSAVPYTVLSKSVGNNKAIFTVPSSFAYNRFKIGIDGNTETAGNAIKLAPNIRVFELPAGSTIESDFNTMTADQLALKYPYVKGDKVYGSGAQRLVSVTKNIVKNGNCEDGISYWSKKNNPSISIVNGVFSIATTDVGQGMYQIVSVKQNTDYYLSYASLSGGSVRIYDNEALATLIKDGSGTFNTGLNSKIVIYVRSGSATTVTVNKLQIEKGSIATPYEPHRNKKLYLPATGCSLPNGVVDQINILSGLHTKNVQEYTLQASDVNEIYTSLDYVDWIGILKRTDDVLYNNSVGSLANSQAYGILGYSAIATRGSVLSTGYYVVNYSNTIIMLGVPKGTYADLAAAKAALAGTKIYYQLATPIVTPLQLHGASEFELYPNGSVYSEPCLSGWTNTASTVITTSAMPIKSIRKVSKYTYVGHQRVETDVTADASTADNLTLTIANFDTKANYFYDCEYDSQYSTNPLMEINAEVDGGVLVHDYLAGAVDWTLTANESLAEYLILSNAGGAVNVIRQAQSGTRVTVENNSGQTATIKIAGGTGATVATGKIATFIFNGTIYKKISEV